MKKVAIIALMLISGLAYGQEAKYTIKGNEIVKVEQPAKTKKGDVKTELTHLIKGETFPVYQGAKGSYYIIRKSKKTGKEYRQYLDVK